MVPVMSDVIKIFYNEHKEFGINSLRRRNINRLAASTLAGGKKNILDVGCATGFVSSPLRSGGNYVVGIDIAEKAIAQAKEALDEAYVFDIEQYPWPDFISHRTYDLIMVSEVIEHLFDQRALLAQVKKLLASQGKIIITTPNFLVWSDRIKMLLGIYTVLDPGHIKMLSYREFRKLCKDESLSIVAEDHIWKPNWIERFAWFLPPNLFAYQIIVKVRLL